MDLFAAFVCVCVSFFPRSRSRSRSLALSLPPVSAFIRCGFAGEPRPIHVVPSPIGLGHDCIGNGGGGGGMARTKEEWVELLTGVLSRMYTDSLQCRPRVSTHVDAVRPLKSGRVDSIENSMHKSNIQMVQGQYAVPPKGKHTDAVGAPP